MEGKEEGEERRNRKKNGRKIGRERKNGYRRIRMDEGE